MWTIRLRMGLIVSAGLCLAVLAGCSGGVTQSSRSRERPSISGSAFGERLDAASVAQAAETDYHGQKALRLSNGLVSVVAVPGLGGRIMEYALGSHPFIWVSATNLAAIASGAAASVAPAPNPGGAVTRVITTDGTEMAPELADAKWTGRVVTARGPAAEVEMTGPLGDGLQLTRRLKLSAGSTKLEVSDSVKNTSDKPITLSIVSSAAVPGSLEPGEKASEQARIYLPAGARGASGSAWWVLSETGDKDQQWGAALDGRLVQVSYRGLAGRIGANNRAGWIAYADDLQEQMLVRRFAVEAGATYPNDGATVTVSTSPAESGSFMEMAILSPVRELKPQEALALAQQWYATRLGGPVAEVTEAGAARIPVALESTRDQLQLAGELGVFAPGKLIFRALDSSGREIGEALASLDVRPETITRLRQPVTLPPGAASVAVSLEAADKRPLGEVAQVKVAEAIAARPTAAIVSSAMQQQEGQEQ